ncbi:MAG: hypothetical protein PHR35_00465 [Kiritimatiellae bacterium]|nr:hypothetical protein [Kiritimatiellia bacterium]
MTFARRAIIVCCSFLCIGLGRGEPILLTPRLPVGYDAPESTEGGPRLADGCQWLETVWPRRLQLVRTAFAGRKPTVLFITNDFAEDKIHALNLEFPIDAVILADYAFSGGREKFAQALASRPRFDCFVLSRVNSARIPDDVKYEILRRVKADGAGLLVIDLFDPETILTPSFLGLDQAPLQVPGIPGDGLRQWTTSKRTVYLTYNYWHGNLNYAPVVKPYAYGKTSIADFGKGRVVFCDTQSHWARNAWCRTLLPSIALSRDMWVEADYHCSLVAKLILAASGHVPACRIGEIQPRGKGDGGAPEIVLSASGKFAGALRWQIRDTWGCASDGGEIVLDLAGGDTRLPVPGIAFKDAGRRFLDVWVEDAGGRTVDWGSSFMFVDRHVDPPRIASDHPDGIDWDAAVSGVVAVPNMPPDARIRIRLVDRHWREVGRLEGASGADEVHYDFSSGGLDGPIWTLHAELVDAHGRIASQSHVTEIRPQPRSKRGGLHVLGTLTHGLGHGFPGPELAARLEFLRRLGFLANRPYSPGDPIQAETCAWSDIQMHPFLKMVSPSQRDWTRDHISDWEEPSVQEELRAGSAFQASSLRRYGLRGFNLTDDSGAAEELPPGAYTTARFHKWLADEYGGLEETLKAWGWNEAFQQPESGNTLPSDPYAILAFHEWLRRKYGGIAETATAWKLNAAPSPGSMREFGAIEPEMIEELGRKGNDAPRADARAFMSEQGDALSRNPWGAITPTSIKAAFSQGTTAPWIDARRFLIERWTTYMKWADEAAGGIDPELVVGSDAGLYGDSLYAVADAVNYFAPYHDNLALKLGVARGRMRKDGDFGSCLGTYGGKPNRMHGRRAQIWEVLFAGGNGIYYWILAPGPGIQGGIRLSDHHALYQAEVIEELSSGIGELFTSAQRVFDPVALLASETSAICDRLEKADQPISTEYEGMRAFLPALQDHLVNPDFITSDELASGLPVDAPVRLLVLPSSHSLSEKEPQSIRTFVQAGGVVLADIYPGRRLPNGNLRQAPALDDVFGVTTDASEKRRRVRGTLSGRPLSDVGPALDFGKVLADPRIRATTASSFGEVEGAQALLLNRHGKGAAVLLNASFSAYNGYRVEGGELWRAWHGVVKQALALANVPVALHGASQGEETPGFEISPFRMGEGYLVGVAELGSGDFIGSRRPFELTLPAPLHVYEIRSQRYLGKVSRLEDDIPRRGHRAYALLPYSVTGVELASDASRLAQGQTIALKIDVGASTGRRGLHVIRLEAIQPDGSAFYPFRKVLKLQAGKRETVPLTFAFDDAPGRWTFIATDVISGRRATIAVDLDGTEALP